MESPTPEKQQQQQKCIICFEDSSTAGDILFCLGQGEEDNNPCDHTVCHVCLRYYLIQCENDRKSVAKCPHPECQEMISNNVVLKTLGRTYEPKVWGVSSSDNKKQKEENIDESFFQWLKENEAFQCKNCHAWIIKEEGCDAVQCLCGWRFCWSCQQAMRANNNNDDDDDCDGERCACGYEVEDFYDNILGSEGNSQVPRLATLSELKDFSAFYERRKDEDCGDYESYDGDEVEAYAVDEIVEEE